MTCPPFQKLVVPFILSLIIGLGLGGCSDKVEMAASDNQRLSQALSQLVEQANYASSHDLNRDDNVLQEELILHNDLAFQSKLEIIQGAQQTLDLMYFIFATDESSSVLSEALIAAASQRNVKVRLLVDYLTNYHNLDHFRMLERQGGGNLEVRFYGRPTRNIVKDAVYLTMSCPGGATDADCNEEKFAAIDRLFAAEESADSEFSNLNTGLSGMFLSGLYGKNPEVMALAILAGQELTSVDAAAGQELTAEDQAGLKKIAQLLWAANTGSPLTRLNARIQLGLAKMLHGEAVTPIIDGSYNALPIGRAGHYRSDRDWRFLSDYLHMKLLAADSLVFQLGGRNIENSYHIDQPTLSNGETLTGKYIFMDTDMLVRLQQPNQQIRNAFSRIWEFTEMVAPLEEVAAHAPNDFLVNLERIKERIHQQECQTESAKVAVRQAELDRLTDREALHALRSELADEKRQLDGCVSKALPTYWETADALLSQAARMDLAQKEMAKKAATYRDFYKAKQDFRPGLDIIPLDPQNVHTYYLENTPFAKGASSDQADTASARSSGRRLGAQNQAERDSGKEIHALWTDALRRTCEAAQRKPAGETARVVLHNAYFLLPSNLLTTIANMVADPDCSRVNIQVLTNSIFTTDLNVINLVSRHSLKAFAEHYQQVKAANPNQGASVAYYEYHQNPADSGLNRSLHSKVTVFDDSCLLVGSANADVRSYMMDANNGFFVCTGSGGDDADRSTSGIAAYLSLLDRQMQNRATRTDVIAFANRDRAKLLAEDRRMVLALGEKYRAERWLTAEQTELFISDMNRMLEQAYQLSAQAIAEGADSDAAEEFNLLFKTL